MLKEYGKRISKNTRENQKHMVKAQPRDIFKIGYMSPKRNLVKRRRKGV